MFGVGLQAILRLASDGGRRRADRSPPRAADAPAADLQSRFMV
jgi:hypothetical protein